MATISQLKVGGTTYNIAQGSGYTQLFYGTCSTAAGTAAKVVTCAEFASAKLVSGAAIMVNFTYANTASTPTLNVNSSGAKTIRCTVGSNVQQAIPAAAALQAGTHLFVYDGTYWILKDPGYTDIKPTYGTCGTAAATAAKAVTLAGYYLNTGRLAVVKFTYAVPANATLNINSTGAKNIYYKGAKIVAGIIDAGDTATFMYDGTQYQLISIDRATAHIYYGTTAPTSSVGNVGDIYVVYVN